jgi:hypothetical protein
MKQIARRFEVSIFPVDDSSRALLLLDSPPSDDRCSRNPQNPLSAG